MLWAFVPVAIVVTLTPGAGTAMIVRNALRGGSRAGLLTILGNSIGVVAWALLSVLGISALVAASEVAFVALEVTGAVVLVWYTTLAVAVSRAKQAVVRTRVARWMERVTGAVLLGLGVRVALEG